VIVNGRLAVAAGTAVRFAVTPEHTLVFDTATGRRLR